MRMSSGWVLWFSLSLYFFTSYLITPKSPTSLHKSTPAPHFESTSASALYESPLLHLYKGSSFFPAKYDGYWRFLTRILMMELDSTPQLGRFMEIRREELMNSLGMLAMCSTKGQSCDLGGELITMTNNIICRMGMSTRCSGDAGESSEIRILAKEIAELAAKLSVGDVLGPLEKFDLFGYGRNLRGVFERFDKLLESIIVEHEKEERGGWV